MPQEEEGVLLERAQGLILISNTPKGRAVYANRDIAAGEILDVSPVLVLSAEENHEHIERTCLFHYTYNWPITTSNEDGTSTTETRQAIVFGLGSMFNHSTNSQNVGWTRDLSKSTITYRALQDIPAGQELCISYGSRLTFKDADNDNSDAGAEEEREDADAKHDGTEVLAHINVD